MEKNDLTTSIECNIYKTNRKKNLNILNPKKKKQSFCKKWKHFAHREEYK